MPAVVPAGVGGHSGLRKTRRQQSIVGEGMVVCPFWSESSFTPIVRVILIAIVVCIVIKGDSTIVGLRIHVLILW